MSGFPKSADVTAALDAGFTDAKARIDQAFARLPDGGNSLHIDGIGKFVSQALDVQGPAILAAIKQGLVSEIADLYKNKKSPVKKTASTLA